MNEMKITFEKPYAETVFVMEIRTGLAGAPRFSGTIWAGKSKSVEVSQIGSHSLDELYRVFLEWDGHVQTVGAFFAPWRIR